ncbi:MAG: glycosyltransferase family 4 protein [Anaerolineae bacterium]|nr:glycosyltransferase family 4 protein [Anaerolineae bacterium]
MGAERVQTMLVTTIARLYPIDFNPISVPWPFQRLYLPAMYSLLPAHTWWGTRNRAINHITHHTYAHLLHILPLHPCVVSCLDLLELLQLETGEMDYSPQRQRHIHRAIQGMLRADRIIALSEYTKKTILDRFVYPEDQIVVIYPGIDLTHYTPRPPNPAVLQRYGIDPTTPYVLYVGSEQKRKNLKTLVSAFHMVRHDSARLNLVKVGPTQDPAGRAALLAQIQSLGLQDSVHIVDYVEEADLPHLYATARAFVFPSTGEGFGLPPLEAMACGAPVICSNAMSLPEVVGEAALLVDPMDGVEMARLLKRVLDEPDLRQTLRGKGLEQAARYGYVTAAHKMVQIYQDLEAEMVYAHRN